MSEPRVLIVDDEPQVLRALRTALTGNGFAITTASTGEAALDLLSGSLPDAMILDLNLPGISGLDVVRQVREWAPQLPILVVSVREAERDKVAALDLGADDFITKPFGMEELIARVRVALRHSAQAAGADKPSLSVGDLTIDMARHVVTRGGEEVKLTATEYKLLFYLTANADKVVTHQTLLYHVWGPGYEGESQYLRVYMNQLRRKLERDPAHPRFLITEPGIGYRLQTPA